MQGITFTEHLQKSQELTYSSCLGDSFTALMQELLKSTNIIAKEVSQAGLVGALGSTGKTNIQGESVQKLDDLANAILIERLQKINSLYAIGSEEEEDIIICKKEQRGSFVIYFDPLDGSSNIDVNISIGTIFSIYKLAEEQVQKDLTIEDLMPQGLEQVCAGYVLYGASTILVYSIGNNVHSFTYNKDSEEFILTQENIKMPESGTYYSVNTGNENIWDTNTKKAVNYFVENAYSMRYVGSLVADFHRTLLKGGVYLYPQDTKQKAGKLRLMYEANPLAFLAEKADGMATNGIDRILEIKATNVHARTPLVIGSTKEVTKIKEILKG